MSDREAALRRASRVGAADQSGCERNHLLGPDCTSPANSMRVITFTSICRRARHYTIRFINIVQKVDREL